MAIFAAGDKVPWSVRQLMIGNIWAEGGRSGFVSGSLDSCRVGGFERLEAVAKP
ncbi:hypothetical protein [Sphingorhabdus sp. EL138]|uniref:hypothetical protein n=1 Tax=Sphingorhabdus sp. EL138 TaxID=2073156 RepID=UPI0025D4BCC9|nr:hypothetical protein [Sphingorhabdus sp. EL138]